MENIYIWEDGTWCYQEDLQEYLTFMSDSFYSVDEDTFEQMIENGEI